VGHTARKRDIRDAKKSTAGSIRKTYNFSFMNQDSDYALRFLKLELGVDDKIALG
jgi:hypothetical protein